MKVKDLIQELIKLNLQGYGESEVILEPDYYTTTRVFVSKEEKEPVVIIK